MFQNQKEVESDHSWGRIGSTDCQGPGGQTGHWHDVMCQETQQEEEGFQAGKALDIKKMKT